MSTAAHQWATDRVYLSLPHLERILRLLTYALHRRDLGLDDFSAEMLALNQGYIEEAKELLAELAKRDAATFTRKVIEQGEPKESPDDEFERELKEYPAPGSDPMRHT